MPDKQLESSACKLALTTQKLRCAGNIAVEAYPPVDLASIELVDIRRASLRNLHHTRSFSLAVKIVLMLLTSSDAGHAAC